MQSDDEDARRQKVTPNFESLANFRAVTAMMMKRGRDWTSCFHVLATHLHPGARPCSGRAWRVRDAMERARKREKRRKKVTSCVVDVEKESEVGKF